MTTSTRINIFKCTYVHLCLFHSKLPHWFQCVLIYIGLLANNATWCQNRGCICISSTRRTYSRIHAVSCIHPVIQTSTIILSTELFPKKRREKISKERFFKDLIPAQIQEYPVKIQGEILHSTRNPASYKLILYTVLILQQLQGSSYAGLLQQLFPVYPSILHGRIKLQASYSVPGPYSTSRLPVILPSRKSILHGSQPTRSPSSNSQAHTTRNPLSIY